MRRITPPTAEALFSAATTRALEQRAAQALPPHTLMARAGDAVARLARALHPHARRIWVACGPGNNGGDGLIAALHLHRAAVAGRPEVIVTHHAQADRLPPDAEWALGEARAAGLRIATCVGGMDASKERRTLNQGVQIVVGTPGRLRDHLERGALDLSALRVAVLGIILSTILGTLVGVGRLSPNWLLAKICEWYVEAFRNVPLLLWLFLFYKLISEAFPGPRQAISALWGSLFLSNRGLYFPVPMADPIHAMA